MLRKGAKIKEFVLTGKLGTGGFAEVWQAEKKTELSVSRFALKFFRPKEGKDFDLIKIKQEIETWQAVSGLPHIISIFEADRFDDYIYIVNEFADGGSLEKWLVANDGKAESFEQAVTIIREVLVGLENLHRQGFVHRDLKPANVLIRRGQYCLSDFGVTRQMKTHSKTIGTAGTCEYMPPEAFSKSSKITAPTDIWSAGVMLQELLTGEIPFPSDDFPILLSAIQHEKPELMPADVPSPLRDIVKKSLNKNPDKRYQTAREMRVALEKALLTFSKTTITDYDEIFGEREAAIRSEAEAKSQAELERQRRESDTEKLRLEQIVEQMRQQAAERERAERDRISRARAEQAERNERARVLQARAEEAEREAKKRQEITQQREAYAAEQARLKKLANDAQRQAEQEKSIREQLEKKIKAEMGGESVQIHDETEQTEISKKPDYLRVGMAFYKNQDYDCALEYFNEEIKQNPVNSDAYNERGNVYFVKQQFAAAIADYTKSVELNPKNDAAFNNRGCTYFQLGQYYETISDCSKASDINPQASYYYNRGNAYYRRQQYRFAVQDYDKAIELDPDNADYKDIRAIAAAKHIGKPEETKPLERAAAYSGFKSIKGIAYFLAYFLAAVVGIIILFGLIVRIGFIPEAGSTKVAQLKAETIDYLQTGKNCAEKKDYDCAVEDFTLAIEQNPQNAEAYHNRGLAYYNNQKYDEAIADCTKAIELDSKLAAAYENRGDAYFKKKLYEKAIADYKAIKLNSKIASAYNSRAVDYHNNEQDNKAVADYTKVIEIDPLYHSAYNGRGDIYYNKKQYKAAISDYTKTLELNPEYANVYFTRGYCYYFTKQNDKAIADFTKAIEINPKYESAYNGRGNAYSEKKKYDDAIADYTKLVELNPNADYGYYNRGIAYSNKKQYDTAINDYTKAIELNPTDADGYNARASVYEQLNRKSLAAADRRKYNELKKK